MAFWPRVLPLPDRLPETATARAYAAEARETIAWARDNPVQQVLDLLLVQRWRLSDWRTVPGSGEGSPAVPEAADVLVTAQALGPWGLPISKLTICCGGSGFSGIALAPVKANIGRASEAETFPPPPPPPLPPE